MRAVPRRIATLSAGVATVCMLLRAGVAAAPADPAPPSEAFAHAVAVMGGLGQSPYATFTTSVKTAGFGVRTDEENGVATLAVGFGSAFKPEARWDVALRSADGAAVLRKPDGPSIVTRSQLFKPTWQGAYQWTRYGFGHPAPDAPASAATAGASDDGQTVIGRVQSIAPGAYVIEDAAALACPDGSTGRHLHLTARAQPAAHPLTDVVIDDAGGRICSMRFTVERGNAFSVNGAFDLDFGTRGGYWVVTGGRAQVVFRVFGLGAKRGSIELRYDDFAFGSTPSDPMLAS